MSQSVVWELLCCAGSGYFFDRHDGVVAVMFVSENVAGDRYALPEGVVE